MPVLKTIKEYLHSLVTLIKEEKEGETLHEIIEGTRFAGHNFWIMGFAMVLACVGLNNDSLSAVIGAMLISPLMGPVTALAFGLATGNQSLMQTAFVNWLLMTATCLVASVLFFYISPFTILTAQLQSFSKPTLFDVFLAFFGGLAGFIGICRKDGTKVIAGVAVATSCMPPLCTAGYGLVSGNWTVMAGGLYFYFINSLFIGVATFILSRIMGYHRVFRRQSNIKPLHTVSWLLLIAVALIPALYIGLIKWKKQDFEYKAGQFTTALQQHVPEALIIKDSTVFSSDEKKLQLFFINDSMLLQPRIDSAITQLQPPFSVLAVYGQGQHSNLRPYQLKLQQLEQRLNKQDSIIRQLQQHTDH
jgi:uncharacterized hydrophobic protein (TIGR00271 family)